MRRRPCETAHPNVCAIEAIVRTQRRQLLERARREVVDAADAEDVVQSAVVCALERAHEMPAATNWSAWLTVVIKRAAIDVWRREHRRARMLATASTRTMSVSEPELAGRERLCERAQSALDACAPVLRETFELWHAENLSYQAIAQRQGVLANTVASRIHRVRRRLQSELGAHLVDY